jgi:sugar phosphate isomerase/epimerase
VKQSVGGRLHMRRREFIGGLAASAAAAPRPVGLAAGTYGMRALQIGAALDLAADIGYDGVQICLIPGWPTDPAKLSREGRAEIRTRLRDRHLALPALMDSLPLVAEKREYNRTRVRLAAELAHDLSPERPPCLDTVLGLKTADWETVRGRMAEEVRGWAEIAESAKMTVAIKLHADQAMDTAEKALWMLEQVASPRIRLVYDYSHLYLAGARQLLPQTAYISVKDSRREDDRSQYLLPGDGGTDYVAYFRLLRDLGYGGFAGVEVSSQIHGKAGYDPVATSKLCYGRLAPAFQKAGLPRPGRG